MAVKRVGAVAVRCSYGKMVATHSLAVNPQNPNTHPPDQIKLLAKIIREQGWRNPIVVSLRSGLITRGHGRLEAARLLGEAMVPVDFQEYATEQAELADMIADNRIAELAEMDRSHLRELMETLDDGAFDVGLAAFDMEALEELMTAAPPEYPTEIESGGHSLQIIIECESAREQKELIDRFKQEKLRFRVPKT